MRDELVSAIFQAAGLGVPFDDMRPVKDQLFIKHHGALGECLSAKCGACDAVARDLAAIEAKHHPGVGFDPPAGLPPGIDPRSPAALEWVNAEFKRWKGTP